MSSSKWEEASVPLIILPLLLPIFYLILCVALNMNPMCHTLPYHSLLTLDHGGMLSLGRSCLALLSLLVDRSLTMNNDELQHSVDEVIFW